MDAPQIRYTTTRDGVRIAYYAVGAGEPILVTGPMGLSHLLLEYNFPPVSHWYEHMSRERTLVRWDPRSLGISERKVQNIGVDAYDLDLDAVFAALAVSSADIVASGPLALTALGYAARHPERVRKLILINVLLRWIELFPGAAGQAILALAEHDWPLFCENAAHARRGWSQRGGHQFAEFIRESERQDDFLRALPFRREWNVSNLLPNIRADTLVIYGERGDSEQYWRRRMQQAAMEMASQIAGARVVEVAGTADFWMSSEDVRAAIDDFLGIDENRSSTEQAAVASGTAIILFADVVDSTALAEQLGNTAYRERSRTLEERVRTAISSSGGAPVEGRTLGDGVLGVFTSASDAIAAALQCALVGEEIGLALHLGLHAGDVLREGSQVHGQAVSIASRVSDLSAPNEVLVSGTVRDLARASSGVTFEDRGEHALKGVGEPQRLFAVRQNEV